MIYAIPIDKYPTDFIEELSYRDENDFEWRICRTKEGFIVRYFGDEYFKENSFDCETSDGKHHRIKNTNCILFLDTDFDAFMDMRTILRNGYTDEIWESIEELFTERMEHDTKLLESEVF